MLVLVKKKDFYKFQKYVFNKGYKWVTSGKKILLLDDRPNFYDNDKKEESVFILTSGKKIAWWGNGDYCCHDAVFVDNSSKLELE